MSKSSSDNQSIDLNGLDFGPAWARKSATPEKQYSEYKGEKHQRNSRQDRFRSDRGGKPVGKRHSGQGGRPASGSNKKHFKSNKKPRRIYVAAEIGVNASIMPIEEGVDNLVKEISASGRTYSVFDLARVVLAARERFSIILRSDEKENGPELFQCKHDGAVFITQDECVAYSANEDWLSEIYKSEEIEVEAPAGEFKNIAKCGMSGELLGPTNFHGYQERITELHRAKFSNLSIESYKKRIVTESGEEVVSAWKESMTKQTVFKLVSDESVMFDHKTAMLQHFASSEFERHFDKTRRAQVPSLIEARKISASLLTNLKECIQEQRRYPGDLSSFLCRQLSGRQLAVFKWQGKLHCGPSRPHMLPEDLNMADRPKAIYSWVSEHVGAGVDALWKSVCPVDIEEKVKFEWYHDLHWLINEGYVIFMNNGLLFPSSASKKLAKKKQAKKKPISENKKHTDQKTELSVEKVKEDKNVEEKPAE